MTFIAMRQCKISAGWLPNSYYNKTVLSHCFLSNSLHYAGHADGLSGKN